MATKASLDITDRIEQTESFEKRFGIGLSALAAFLKEDYGERQVSVFGEIRAENGNEINSDLVLTFVAYDSHGRVVGLDEKSYAADCFFDFDVFQVSFYVPKCKIDKLKIFPKRN